MLRTALLVLDVVARGHIVLLLWYGKACVTDVIENLKSGLDVIGSCSFHLVT